MGGRLGFWGSLLFPAERRATCPTSWCWLFPASPESVAAECHHRRRSPSPGPWPGRSRCPEEERPAGTAAAKHNGLCESVAAAAVVCHQVSGPHLLVQCEGIDLRQNPADAAVTSAHQDPEGVKLLEETQTDRGARFKSTSEMNPAALHQN